MNIEVNHIESVANAGFFRSASAFMNLLLATLKTVAEYYPGRLHKAFVIDPPSLFSYLWKVKIKTMPTLFLYSWTYLSVFHYHCTCSVRLNQKSSTVEFACNSFCYCLTTLAVPVPL
jgi:hypothetical protein